MNNMSSNIAFIDLDHCLVNCNLSEVMLQKMFQKQLLPSSAIAVAGLIKFLEKKEAGGNLEDLFQMGYALCAGIKEQTVRELAEEIVQKNAPSLMNPPMLDILEWHRLRKDRLILLSCSSEYLVKPFAAKLSFDDSFSLKQETFNGIFTGKISGITNGKKKVELVTKYANEHHIDLEDLFFYSDSYDDESVLSIVGHPFATYPDPLLKQVALKKHWTILESDESFKRATLDKILILTATSWNHKDNLAQTIQEQIRIDKPNCDPIIIYLDQEHLLFKAITELDEIFTKDHPEIHHFFQEAIKGSISEMHPWIRTLVNNFTEKLNRKYHPKEVIALHPLATQLFPSSTKR